MTVPPLYKYLDIDGARKTLTNRCLKHAKPSTFNDVEDMTVKGVFPEDDERALTTLKDGFIDVLVKHVDDAPTCLNVTMRAKVAVMLKLLKAKPELAEMLKSKMASAPLGQLFTLDGMRTRNANYLADINLFMQNYRILCLSTLNSSDRMWERYAEGHAGVVIRIVPNLEKDSKYQMFKPVSYREHRPTLYKSAASFQEESLFGDQTGRITEAMETIIYSKTLEWEYESEWRLAISLGHGEHDWDLLAYHPDEISELYIGAKATPEFKDEIVALGRAVNPQIRLFQMSKDTQGALIATEIAHPT